MSYVNLPNMIIHDCYFALKHLVNEETFNLIYKSEKIMKENILDIWIEFPTIYDAFLYCYSSSIHCFPDCRSTSTNYPNGNCTFVWYNFLCDRSTIKYSYCDTNL